MKLIKMVPFLLGLFLLTVGLNATAASIYVKNETDCGNQNFWVKTLNAGSVSIDKHNIGRLHGTVNQDQNYTIEDSSGSTWAPVSPNSTAHPFVASKESVATQGRLGCVK